MLSLLLIAVKMVVEFMGMFNEFILQNQMYPFLAFVIITLLYIVLQFRVLLSKEFWKDVKFTVIKKTILIILLLSYVSLNLPILLSHK